MRCTDKLAVIVTAKDSVDDIRTTIRNSNVFNRDGCSTLLVTTLSDVPPDVISHFRWIIKDDGLGVYQAMNKGLEYVRKSDCTTFVTFCNAGDLLNIKDIDSLVGDRCFVTDLNIFKGHPAINLDFISKDNRLDEMASKRFRHPGFIAPLAGASPFLETMPISADQAWVESLVECYGVRGVDGAAGFGLGGLSTTYNFTLVRKYFIEREYKRGVIVVGRMALNKARAKFFFQDLIDAIVSKGKGVYAAMIVSAGRRSAKRRIYVLSNGRSGSTMVFNALAVAMSNFYDLPRSLLTLTDWKFKNDGNMPGIVKSHMPCPDGFAPKDGCKYVYVAGDPVDATLSLLSRLQEFGLRWMERHARHLGVDGEAIFSCLKQDSFNQCANIASWKKAAEKYPRHVIFISFDTLWDREDEISQFVGFECNFPKKRSRKSETIKDRLVIKNELEKIFYD